MELERKVGLTSEGRATLPDRAGMVRSIMFKLAAMGFEVPEPLWSPG